MTDEEFIQRLQAIANRDDIKANSNIYKGRRVIRLTSKTGSLVRRFVEEDVSDDFLRDRFVLPAIDILDDVITVG